MHACVPVDVGLQLAVHCRSHAQRSSEAVSRPAEPLAVRQLNCRNLVCQVCPPRQQMQSEELETLVPATMGSWMHPAAHPGNHRQNLPSTRIVLTIYIQRGPTGPHGKDDCDPKLPLVPGL